MLSARFLLLIFLVLSYKALDRAKSIRKINILLLNLLNR